MKHRNLTGVFIRWMDPGTKQWGNWDISDLPFVEVTKWMDSIKPEEQLAFATRLLQVYHERLQEMAEELDLSAVYDEEDTED